MTGDETYTYVRGINLIFGRARYYLYNAHGDVVQLTNSNGQLAMTEKSKSNMWNELS